MLERITGQVVPERFRGRDLLTRLKYRNKIGEWKKKLKRFDRLYELPTVKMAIAPHLVRGVEQRYQVPCYLLPNGINPEVFYQKEKELDYTSTLKILSVGNYGIEYKAIPDIMEAVRILKKQGRDVSLTRVSPADIPEVEKNSGIYGQVFFKNFGDADGESLPGESYTHLCVNGD